MSDTAMVVFWGFVGAVITAEVIAPWLGID
jgi:hypothetical protein